MANLSSNCHITGTFNSASLAALHSCCFNITIIEKEAPSAWACSSITVTGGTIHMVCRNKDKAEEARADIVKETGNKVEFDSPL